MQEEITYFANCVSLIMVTITSHIFIIIFQTIHFSAVKFTRGSEKNMSFLIPKSLKVRKKSEAIGPGSLIVLSIFLFPFQYLFCPSGLDYDLLLAILMSNQRFTIYNCVCRDWFAMLTVPVVLSETAWSSIFWVVICNAHGK